MQRRSSSLAHTTSAIVAFTVSAYALLLVLCPKALRETYGVPMIQDFRQYCCDAHAAQGSRGVIRLWLPTLGDVLTSALAEHVTTFLERMQEVWSMSRVRASALIVFCAYIGFVIAGLGLQKLSEYDDFTQAANVHPTIGVSFSIIVVGSVVALLAVLIGGLPLAVASLRYALSARRTDILVFFALPVLAFLLLIGYIAVAKHVLAGETTHITTGDVLFSIGLVAVLVVGAVASVAGVCLAVLRSRLNDDLVQFTRVPGVLTGLTMAVICVATITWGLGLRAGAPQLFNGNDGFLATSTSVAWLVIVTIMGITSVVALVAALRGLAAPRTPAPPLVSLERTTAPGTA